MREADESTLGAQHPRASTGLRAGGGDVTAYAGTPMSHSGPIVHNGFDLTQLVHLAANFGHSRFGYVVTANVDHLVRYHEDANCRAFYRDATFVLPGSRFCALLLRLLRGVRLPVGTGSDLSAELLSSVARPTDRILVLGASTGVVESLAAIYGLRDLCHYNPPANFMNHPEKMEQCLRFIEQASPFRFCFLAVGTPQQEVVAQRLHSRGTARGLALCIGSSLNFIAAHTPNG